MTDAKASNSDEDLWTPKDVAKYLKVSRSWVYLRAEAGDIPCLRVGALLRFEPEQVRKYARGELNKKVITLKNLNG